MYMTDVLRAPDTVCGWEEAALVVKQVVYLHHYALTSHSYMLFISETFLSLTIYRDSYPPPSFRNASSSFRPSSSAADSFFFFFFFSFFPDSPPPLSDFSFLLPSLSRELFSFFFFVPLSS